MPVGISPINDANIGSPASPYYSNIYLARQNSQNMNMNYPSISNIPLQPITPTPYVDPQVSHPSFAYPHVSYPAQVPASAPVPAPAPSPPPSSPAPPSPAPVPVVQAINPSASPHPETKTKAKKDK
jgi:hypothetical protein